MRTRERFGAYRTVSPVVFDYVCADGPDGYTGQTYNWSYHTSYEQIVDDPRRRYVQTRRGRRVALMKPTSHEKWEFYPTTSYAHVQRSPTICLQTSVNTAFGPSSDVAVYYANVLKSHIPAITRTAGDRWEAVRPSMSTRANLAVFAYELREFTRLFEIIPFKHFSFQNWAQVLKAANSGHLNYNFGWKPFLREIDTLAREIHGFEHRLRMFVYNADQDLRRHVNDAPTEVSIDTDTYFNTNWNIICKGSIKQQCRSTFDFSYEVPQMSYSEFRLRSWLDTLGLQLTPRNIWAVCPWSFVVDWFLGVSKLLKSDYDDWVVPWIYLLQSCTSSLVTGHISISLRWKNFIVQDFSGGSLNYRAYNRTLGGLGTNLTTPPLDADKIRLLASLVGSLL